MMLQTPHGLQEWEDFASGRAIKEKYGRLAEDIHDPAEWHAIVQDLTLGFQVLIPLLQPQTIIIGGSVGKFFDRYGHLLSEALRKNLADYIALPSIIQAQHPEEAVIYGCYYYATHQAADSTIAN